MAKYRKLYTRILESEDVNAMPDDFTRLTWTYLMLVVDSEGRALDNTANLRSKLYPMREDVTLEMVRGAIDWFAAHGMVRRYEVDGRRYLEQCKFKEYQGDTSKEARSIYPAPPVEAACEASGAGERFTSAANGTVQQGKRSTGGMVEQVESKTGIEQDQLESSSGVTLTQVEGDSDATPELVASNSSTDSYSDSEANSDSEAESAPAREARATQGESSPQLARLGLLVADLLGLSANNREMLEAAVQEYGADVVEYALNEAYRHNARSWAYVETIMHNRKTGGSPSQRLKQRARDAPRKPATPAYLRHEFTESDLQMMTEAEGAA